MAKPTTLESLAKTLFAHAMTHAESVEDHPWGHTVAKVRGKIFFFCDMQEAQLCVTAKLPASGAVALQLPFCQPTGYGLGKSGWVSARFERPDQVPVDMLMEWADESYQAVAPRSLTGPSRTGKAAVGKDSHRKDPAVKSPTKNASAKKVSARKKTSAKEVTPRKRPAGGKSKAPAAPSGARRSSVSRPAGRPSSGGRRR